MIFKCHCQDQSNSILLILSKLVGLVFSRFFNVDAHLVVNNKCFIVLKQFKTFKILKVKP